MLFIYIAGFWLTGNLLRVQRREKLGIPASWRRKCRLFRQKLPISLPRLHCCRYWILAFNIRLRISLESKEFNRLVTIYKFPLLSSVYDWYADIQSPKSNNPHFVFYLFACGLNLIIYFLEI